MAEPTDTPPLEVLATPFEMLRAAAGHPQTLKATDGQEVVLRIPTVEEFKQTLTQARAWFEERHLPIPDPPTDAQIRAIVTPLPG